MTKRKKADVDIFSVARAAGVSISTVSRAFNHPNLVKSTTRRKIDKAIKSTGYIRNRAAQAMHGRRSETIGLIVPTIDHTIFGELIQAFAEAIEVEGFSLILATHTYDLNKEYQLLRKLLEHRVDGVALVGLEHKEETFDLIETQNIPCLTLWNYGADSRLDCVGASNHEAGYLACRHLLDAGHRRIGFVFPDTRGNDRSADRQRGAMQALRDAQAGLEPAFVNQVNYSIGTAKQECIHLLTSPNRPTAILCANDVIGVGALYAAQHLQISVPGDLSIMAVGDFRGSAETVPSLSTVRIPAKEIGTRAGQQLCQRIGQNDGVRLRYECALQVMPRQTTSKPQPDETAGNGTHKGNQI